MAAAAAAEVRPTSPNMAAPTALGRPPAADLPGGAGPPAQRPPAIGRPGRHSGAGRRSHWRRVPPLRGGASATGEQARGLIGCAGQEEAGLPSCRAPEARPTCVAGCGGHRR